MKRYPTIGVIGGMGPETTIAFYAEVIGLFQRELGARHNFEFPEMFIHNVPSPDNVEAGVGPELLPYMLDSARRLARAGANLIVCPCNSAHVFMDEVKTEVDVPCLNIIEETVAEMARQRIRHALILATKSTLREGLYQRYCPTRNIELRIPSREHQDETTRIIMKVCEGKIDVDLKKDLANLIAAYGNVDGVILGCTELPLATDPTMIDAPLFDTLKILARATFNFAVA